MGSRDRENSRSDELLPGARGGTSLEAVTGDPVRCSSAIWRLASTSLFAAARSSLLVAFGCLVHSALVGAQSSARPAPLRVEDAVGAFGFIPPISLSPDGEWVAYTLQDPVRRGSPGETGHLVFSASGAPQTITGCDVWAVSTKSGEAVNLGAESATSWGPVWSPDSRLLAFYSDRKGQVGLWIWDRATRSIREVPNVTPRPLFAWDVVEWFPDSRSVVLKVQALTPNDSRPRESSAYSGVSNQGASPASFVAPAVAVYENGKAASSARTPAATPWIDDSYADIARADIRTGLLHRFVRSVLSKGYLLSPDGARLAVSLYAGRRPGTLRLELFDLVILSALDGARQAVAPRIPQGFMGRAISWAPDSRTVALVTGGPYGAVDPALGELLLLNVGDTMARRPLQAKHPSFADEENGRPPLWLPSGEGLLVIGGDTLWEITLRSRAVRALTTFPHAVIQGILTAHRGTRLVTRSGQQSIFVRTRDRMSQRAALYEVALIDGTRAKIAEEASFYGDQLQFTIDASSDGKVLAFIVESAFRGEDIWVSRLGEAASRPLTNINPILSRYGFSRSQLVTWISTDGERLQGALLLPLGYMSGKRYPLVVRVYGGLRYSERLNRFSVAGGGVDNTHLFTTRGYAVFLPDAPYRNGATLMRDLAGSILPGVTKVIEMGIADPERIGVFGHSFGGYTTLALLVQSRLFRAAIASAATGDLVATYGVLDPSATSWVEEGQLGMNGTPWTARDRYIENSPVFYLDRIETPLLLVSGSLDGLPTHLAEEVYVGLKRLDKEVAYAKYLGEEHYEGEWSYANKVDYLNRVLNWFDGHLGAPTALPQAAPRGDSAGR
jgi:dipeptidyl aminopeptidase/acylaminoacyl peptidase